MFLSRIPINPARRDTRKFLASPQVIHAAVLSAFPPDTPGPASGEGRVLWRLDQRDATIHLYVVSPHEPDFTHIVEQTGWPTTAAWATRKYDQLLDTLTTGQRWHFRLTANPVRSTLDRTRTENTGRHVKDRGKIAGLSAAEQLDWLRRKATRAGFILTECGPEDQREDDVRLIARDTLRFQRHNTPVTLSVATFEGTLTVSDPILLRAALTGGIGRAKGYGCGLLTIAPTQ
ncbi:type I-E CRISPR-associated protein Cas6/Cse3/CasE [Nocardia sp. alder85J]|uniref:type I-E CRISPR-associated protein Cas6/Cse3/CasE n=1 Tax=Nocardia sp. alder85J TaxID=2862949 RepID=UPI001CD7297B|nr:type I-E CRISPR-associated protein Cas6/Cse3/CasE [Nocardia sp. alder85J]MCX4097897.1 type I-E CRISPR-associated protein Cas6/Cse3/CasE [Nocardia sp. alder85J]